MGAIAKRLSQCCELSFRKLWWRKEEPLSKESSFLGLRLAERQAPSPYRLGLKNPSRLVKTSTPSFQIPALGHWFLTNAPELGLVYRGVKIGSLGLRLRPESRGRRATAPSRSGILKEAAAGRDTPARAQQHPRRWRGSGPAPQWRRQAGRRRSRRPAQPSFHRDLTFSATMARHTGKKIAGILLVAPVKGYAYSQDRPLAPSALRLPCPRFRLEAVV